MRYDDPDLRERLAAEYVLGTMPHRARRRFEQILKQDAALAASVGAWAERFSAIERATPAEEPPARVWRAIAARIAAPEALGGAPGDAPAQFVTGPVHAALRFWRGFAIAASAVAAALI
ncbi:MAG TPA: hypothetical protein VE993_01290, partial [Stellaceae bacterium]|nr:hypothetical protein [Stellaceae bacterium]